MDYCPYALSAIPGAKSVVLKNDWKIEVVFLNSATGEVLADCSGDAAILVSDLLENLPSEALAALLSEVAPRMAALSKGLS